MIGQKQNFWNKGSTSLDYSNWILFGLSVISVLVFLLSSARDCGSFEFCSTSIFLMVMIASWVGVLGFEQLRRNIDWKKGRLKSVNFFFQERITIWKLALTIPGFLGVLLISFLAVQFEQPILGIMGSGFIMMLLFMISKNMMIPIIIHSSYNALVVGLRATEFFSFLSNSPVQVPEIGYAFFDQDLLTEIASQILLVSPAEEIFKVFMVVFFMMIISLKWNPESIWSKGLAGAISVIVWTVYHTIIAV